MFELTRRTGNRIADRYNPFREMEEFERRFFGSPFDSFMTGREIAAFKTDITDEGDHFLLEADLPGFPKENIKLELDGDILTVKAERSSKNEENDEENRVVRRERSYGSYQRQFDVGGIDTDSIKCRYEDGVLKLTLPKKEQILPKARQIEIE